MLYLTAYQKASVPDLLKNPSDPFFVPSIPNNNMQVGPYSKTLPVLIGLGRKPNVLSSQGLDSAGAFSHVTAGVFGWSLSALAPSLFDVLGFDYCHSLSNLLICMSLRPFENRKTTKISTVFISK